MSVLDGVSETLDCFEASSKLGFRKNLILSLWFGYGLSFDVVLVANQDIFCKTNFIRSYKIEMYRSDS